MLRALIWLALLFILATALAILGRVDDGHVLIVLANQRIDFPLNLLVAAIVVGFILFYTLMRFVRNVWTMPSRVAAYRRRARAEKGHAALRDAIGHLFAGRFPRAEKAARDAGELLPENTNAASLVGATAAHRMHEFTRRDEWLSAVNGAQWQDARLTAKADMCADARDPDGALAALGQMQTQGPRRIYAQQIDRVGPLSRRRGLGNLAIENGPYLSESRELVCVVVRPVVFGFKILCENLWRMKPTARNR